MDQKNYGQATMHFANMHLYVGRVRPHHKSLMELAVQHPEELNREERVEVANETERRKQVLRRQMRTLFAR